jgi:hypothetical protein
MGEMRSWTHEGHEVEPRTRLLDVFALFLDGREVGTITPGVVRVRQLRLVDGRPPVCSLCEGFLFKCTAVGRP